MSAHAAATVNDKSKMEICSLLNFGWFGWLVAENLLLILLKSRHKAGHTCYFISHFFVEKARSVHIFRPEIDVQISFRDVCWRFLVSNNAVL